eukprot:7203748-Lingulodinium_polyedra.AAC.1
MSASAWSNFGSSRFVLMSRTFLHLYDIVVIRMTVPLDRVQVLWHFQTRVAWRLESIQTDATSRRKSSGRQGPCQMSAECRPPYRPTGNGSYEPWSSRTIVSQTTSAEMIARHKATSMQARHPT